MITEAQTGANRAKAQKSTGLCVLASPREIGSGFRDRGQRWDACPFGPLYLGLLRQTNPIWATATCTASGLREKSYG